MRERGRKEKETGDPRALSPEEKGRWIPFVLQRAFRREQKEIPLLSLALKKTSPSFPFFIDLCISCARQKLCLQQGLLQGLTLPSEQHPGTSCQWSPWWQGHSSRYGGSQAREEKPSAAVSHVCGAGARLLSGTLHREAALHSLDYLLLEPQGIREWGFLASCNHAGRNSKPPFWTLQRYFEINILKGLNQWQIFHAVFVVKGMGWKSLITFHWLRPSSSSHACTTAAPWHASPRCPMGLAVRLGQASSTASGNPEPFRADSETSLWHIRLPWPW